MFRHSEIHTLLRQQKLRLEEDSDLSMVSASENRECDSKILAEESECNDPDEEEYAAFLEAELRQMKASSSPQPPQRKSKPVREQGGRPPTHRRIARELDAAVTNNDALEYDDEPMLKSHLFEDEGTGSRSAGTFRMAQSTNGPTDSDLNMSTHRRLENEPHQEGKKIWWPTIGA